jgi:hypothetical protein
MSKDSSSSFVSSSSCSSSSSDYECDKSTDSDTYETEKTKQKIKMSKNNSILQSYEVTKFKLNQIGCANPHLHIS